jgi:hypothetical protein
VPSVSRNLARLALLAACGSLLLGAAGCSTTQEKAAHAKARADHILEARAERQKKRADGPKNGSGGNKSAHRPRKRSSNE